MVDSTVVVVTDTSRVLIGTESNKFQDFLVSLAQSFKDCGDFRWVLLAVLILAVALTIERMIFYYISCKRVSPVTAGLAAKSIESGKIETIKKRFKHYKDPLSALIYVTLERYHAGKDLDEIQEGIDEEAVMQVPRFSSRLNYLALFANVATLLGLLGTIAGLQEAFASLEGHEAAEKSAMLAAGISKAMNTTAFGLVIAIPCMAIYTFLNNKQKALVRALDDSVLRLFNYIKRKKVQ